ncbi:hypothetical protein C8R43DRAFT_1140690 [Mycena crocata]|nr:hypothetical protein C8R43DRAFT_1140690 [Mycena crocata]
MSLPCSPLETLLAVENEQFILRFFRYWDPRTIFQLGRLSYRLLNVVRFYQSMVWNVPTLLARWFPDPDAAIAFLRDGPAVFCGPAVMQFFDRKGSEAARLDMCVGYGGLVEAGRFLTAQGYVFRPDASSTIKDFDIVSLMEAACIPERRLKVEGDRSWTQQEHGSRAFKFAKFRRPRRRSPLQVVILHLVRCELHRFIFSGHSTSLMNFITSTHAISVFPCSTFVKRKSFITCQERSPLTDVTVYSDSRWVKFYQSDFGPFDVIGTTADIHSTVEIGRRQIGDPQCWSISLLPRVHPLSVLPSPLGPAFEVLDWKYGGNGTRKLSSDRRAFRVEYLDETSDGKVPV